jgi:hypothetical protein
MSDLVGALSTANRDRLLTRLAELRDIDRLMREPGQVRPPDPAPALSTAPIRAPAASAKAARGCAPKRIINPVSRQIRCVTKEPEDLMNASKIPAAALAVLVLALNGCASAGKPAAPVSAGSTEAAYGSARALIRALEAHGAPCNRVHVLSAPSQQGAATLADCSGKSDGDTSISTFTGHADAVAFAARMIAADPKDDTEVVGPNWVVNTSPAYAPSVQSAIGGQILTSKNAPAVPATSAPPARTPPATPGPSRPTRVRFIVTGSAPDGVDITYGSDSDNRSPRGGLGIDGSGTAVPWRGSVPFDGSAEYYSISAQLNGSGDIRCKIVVTGPGDAPLTVSHGHSSGSYNICRAQAARQTRPGCTGRTRPEPAAGGDPISRGRARGTMAPCLAFVRAVSAAAPPAATAAHARLQPSQRALSAAATAERHPRSRSKQSTASSSCAITSRCRNGWRPAGRTAKTTR